MFTHSEEEHRKALLGAVSSGSPKFFLAQTVHHTQREIKKVHVAAQVVSSYSTVELYAEAFESVGCLDKLEAFASINGATFYGKRSTQRNCAWRKSLDYSVSVPLEKSCGSIKSWDIIKIQAQYRLSR